MRTECLAIMLLAGSFAQPAPPLAYEVASIKRNTSGSDHVSYAGPPATAGFTASNMTLRMLTETAWQMKDSQILGGPAWIGSERYDIAAKPPVGNPSAEQSRAMLRTLLKDRFKLALRRETKKIRVYALLDPEPERKLPAAEEKRCDNPSSPPPDGLPQSPCAGLVMGPGFLASAKTSAAELADVLGKILERPVIDKTQYTGIFAVRLEFTPERNAMSVNAEDAASSRPSLAAAIREQLGLHLELQRAPVEVLVIDHVEKPDAN